MSSMRFERVNNGNGIKIQAELDADDVNSMEEFNALLSDPDIAHLIEKKAEPRGMMKDYCAHCYNSGRNIQFRAWSYAQAIVRAIAECGGPCQVRKGKCS